MYDYNPVEQSLNNEGVEEELAFVEGDVIMVSDVGGMGGASTMGGGGNRRSLHHGGGGGADHQSISLGYENELKFCSGKGQGDEGRMREGEG